MKIKITIMFVLTVMLAQAQGFVCGSAPGAEIISNNKLQTATLSQNNDLGDLRAWIPYCNEEPLKNPPITYINVSFHVFLDDNGDGNRYANNSEGRKKLIGLLNTVNDVYSGKLAREKGPSDKVPGVKELPNYDTRIRFSLGDYSERIYFYKSTEMFRLENSLVGNAGTILYNYISETYPSRMQTGINVFFIASSYGTATAFANEPTYDANRNSYVVVFNCIPSDGADIEWITGKCMAHELGHNLELKHTYCGGGLPAVGCLEMKGEHTCPQGSVPSYHEYDDSEYLSDIFGPCNASTFPHIAKWTNPYDNSGVNAEKITNNVMGGSNDAVYFSPMQAGQMHRAIALKSVGKYVQKNIHSDKPLVIKKTETWDYNCVRLFHDVHIQENGNLTLDTDYEFNKDCLIEIENGGVLHLTGNGFLGMSSSNKIIVKKGGTLVICGSLNVSGTGMIDVQPGGYLCIKKDANVKLNDYLSLIKINNGAVLGVNTSVTSSPGVYYNSLGSIAYNGNGAIAYYTNNKYIQNQTISKSIYISGNNIYAGNSVTTTKAKGDVVVKSGSNLVLDAGNEVLLDKGFLLESGATLEIK